MIEIFKNSDILLQSLADFIVDKAKKSIVLNGEFNLVLSGGSSPKKLFELLASERFRDKIEWKKVCFFFGDERYVPADHPDSNFLMAKKSLFTPLGISDKQIFRINTSLSPEAAARDYEQSIIKHFKNKTCSFDLILLGLGDNSHTASLFPHTTVLHEKKALVKDIYVEEVKMHRITLTAPLINMAKIIVFIVYGESKAEAVRHILKDSQNIDEYPAQLINPEKGELYWFLDEGAAKRI